MRQRLMQIAFGNTGFLAPRRSRIQGLAGAEPAALPDDVLYVGTREADIPKHAVVRQQHGKVLPMAARLRDPIAPTAEAAAGAPAGDA